VAADVSSKIWFEPAQKVLDRISTRAGDHRYRLPGPRLAAFAAGSV